MRGAGKSRLDWKKWIFVVGPACGKSGDGAAMITILQYHEIACLWPIFKGQLHSHFSRQTAMKAVANLMKISRRYFSMQN